MPSAGDQICSSGHVNPLFGASLVIDFASLVIPFLDIPALFSLIYDAIGVVVLDSTSLCTNPPRYPGDPSLQDVVDFTTDPTAAATIREKYLQLGLYSAFGYYCICDTFTPPNVVVAPPPPFPTSTPPIPSKNTPPDLTCNLSGIANKLNGIYALLNLILATVGPQSYSLGTSHTVSGEGEFSVSGIVGCITHPLSYAPGTGYLTGDPTRFFDTGTIAFGDSNGWYPRNPNLHDPQFHVHAPTGTTRIGFTCGRVTSMEITELLPQVLYQGN
jgi:hypothetical protein